MSIAVSVIIVSFNTKGLLRRCITAVVASDLPAPYEIIVVDNASSDGTVAMLQQHFPAVRLIVNQKNLMFAKANNQGIEIARGKYLLFLNSDAFLERDALGLLVSFMETHPQAAVVGPKVLNADGTLQSRGYPLPSVSYTLFCVSGLIRLPDRVKALVFRRFFWGADEIRKVGWIGGCCMLARTATVRAVGGFWGKLNFYGEEVEWCVRAIRCGHEVWYAPEARVIHLGGGSTTPDVIATNLGWRKRLKSFVRCQERLIGRGPSCAWAAIVSLSIVVKLPMSILLGRKQSTARLREALLWEFLTLRIFTRRMLSWLRHGRPEDSPLTHR